MFNHISNCTCNVFVMICIFGSFQSNTGLESFLQSMLSSKDIINIEFFSFLSTGQLSEPKKTRFVFLF